MSVSVQFARTDKKVNSSLVPSLDKFFSCDIYDPCTITSPVIIIAGDNSVIGYNYAYIPDFNRYYFVDNWEWREGRWFASLTVDVLASYRDVIGASSQYVSRAAAAWDGSINDSVYMSKADPIVQVSTRTTPWAGSTYVVGVNGAGGVLYYTMSQVTLANLLSFIFSDEYAESLVEDYITMFPELKAQTNPLQYIASVMYFPLTFDAGGSSTIRVGWVDTPVTASIIAANTIFTRSIGIDVPKHPGGEQYLNLSPYSTYRLNFPPFGVISLDSAMMAGIDSITCEVTVDPRSGEAVLRVEAPDGSTIARVTAGLYMQLQLSQITAPGYGPGSTIQSILGVFGSVVSGVASAASGNIGGTVSSIAGAASGTIGAFRDAAEGLIPSSNTIGGSGGVGAWQGDVQLIATFFPVVSKDDDNKGRPLCQVQTVSALGGYLEIAWPHLEVAATTEEIGEIYRLMRGGFYFE